MTVNVGPTSCASCGGPIEELAGIPESERKPCPSCGSTARRFEVQVNETMKMREMLGMKQKRPGHKKPVYESKSGDDLYKATGQWNKLTREFDRENDRYREIIVNPETGEVIRHVDEPLSQHINRGSAKPKPDKS